MIMCDQFLLLYAAAFQSMNQLRNKAVLLSYIILSSDPYMLTTSVLYLFLSYDQTFVDFEFCSSNHHIGVHLLIICSFDLCEYLVQAISNAVNMKTWTL